VTGLTAANAAVGGVAALLVKYGLKPRTLEQTNMMNPETEVERMASKEVLRVRDAPDMDLMESVRHFTFLLSEQNLKNVNKKKKCKSTKDIKIEVKGFSKQIESAIAEKKPQIMHRESASTLTAYEVTKMVQKSKLLQRRSNVDAFDIKPINKNERAIVIDKARRSLMWANDPERMTIDGAKDMTAYQAAAIMLYTQETCLYRRMNAALREHDMRALEPFLPYMKLLLSALYRLPLVHVQTWRGVKLELHETYNLLSERVWNWRSFSSTTRDKSVIERSPLFFGSSGKRTMFSVNAVGVDIAPFSANESEQEVVLLPGLPLVNRVGKNPAEDLWIFEIETPRVDVARDAAGATVVMIDYVHPGWKAVFHDETWRKFPELGSDYCTTDTEETTIDEE